MLSMYVGKSNDIRCSRYVSGNRIDERLNGEPLEKANYKRGSQVSADRECNKDVRHRKNDGCTA